MIGESVSPLTSSLPVRSRWTELSTIVVVPRSVIVGPVGTGVVVGILVVVGGVVDVVPDGGTLVTGVVVTDVVGGSVVEVVGGGVVVVVMGASIAKLATISWSVFIVTNVEAEVVSAMSPVQLTKCQPGAAIALTERLSSAFTG